MEKKNHKLFLQIYVLYIIVKILPYICLYFLDQYLLGSSSAWTSSKRRVLPSTSFISSSPRSIPMFVRNPPTVGLTVTIAFTEILFSVELATTWAFMLLGLNPTRTICLFFLQNECIEMGSEALQLPWMNGLCNRKGTLVEFERWSCGFSIFGS